MATTNLNLTTIADANEMIGTHFPNAYNANMQTLDSLATALQLADEYDSATNYAVGDYCSHEGKLYKCTAATTGTFDASKWDDSIFVLDEVDGLDTRLTTAESDITSLNTSLTQLLSVRAFTLTPTEYVAVGAIATYNISTTLSGYTLLGVIGVRITSSESCSLVIADVQTTTSVLVRVRNNGSSQNKPGEIAVRCLFLKA